MTDLSSNLTLISLFRQRLKSTTEKDEKLSEDGRTSGEGRDKRLSRIVFYKMFNIFSVLILVFNKTQ